MVLGRWSLGEWGRKDFWHGESSMHNIAGIAALAFNFMSANAKVLDRGPAQHSAAMALGMA